ncbi:MAG TPA: pyridoxal-dependent decarboxylase [Steroidobacteraceae bacterium]|nr:pyridoxal-dependent decarboxylase [Steroidobacteraceae bacterium]
MSADRIPPPVAALFPDRGTRERVEDRLTRALAEAVERVLQGPVTPDLDAAELRRELTAFDFARAQPLEEVIDWVIERLERGTTHVTHPCHFGSFGPHPNFPSQCADRISGAFNPQLATAGAAPGPVAIEQHVIRAMALRAGLPEDSAGFFTGSGSDANYAALVCALTRADARFGDEGVRAFDGAVAMYVSRECEAPWHRIAHRSGIGRSALRLIATDGTGRMDARALAEAVREDRRRGTVPVLVAATAGTAGAGMIDPLEPCATIARECNIWYHIDAGWGGAALCSDRLRAELAGIELADSLMIEAHTWLAATTGCGLFITREPAILGEAFRVGTEMQGPSHFMGLKLFLSLAAAGWHGYGAHVERALQVTTCAEARLRARGWSIVNDSPLAVLCVQPPAGSAPAREIVRKVLASGRAWVGVARYEGDEVVRICATHGEATIADVDELVAALEAAR